MLAEPRSLDPLFASTDAAESLDRLTNDVLVTADAHGTFVPALAAVVPTQANGGISADGRTITYHLRKNVRWHDGAPFTSADVKFTFDAIMNPKNSIETRHGYDLVDRVTTPDPYTVVFRFRTPFAPAIAMIFGESDNPYCIVPKHLLGALHDINRTAYDAAPVGTGPFKVAKWVRGERIEYVANDAYFRGKPKLRRIVVTFVPDENTMLDQLRTHEIDWFMEATIGMVRPLAKLPDTRVLVTHANGYIALMLQTKHAPLGDVRVRRAISRAIDRPFLAANVTFGAAQPATGDLPPFLWAHDARIKPIARDVAEANRLLDAAGLARGADGMRTLAGTPVALDMVYRQGSATDARLAIQLQAELHDVGLVVRPRPLATAVVNGAATDGGILASGRFDLALVPWTSGLDPDDSSQLTCANVAPAGYNEARYCNARIDAAQAIAIGTFDRAKRKAAYAEIERRLVDEAPTIFLLWTGFIEGLSTDVRGVDPNPVVEMWNPWQWSV